MPTVAKDWENMTITEREQLMRVNNIFCGLHFLVGLADCVEETLKVWEAKCTLQESSGSSGTWYSITKAGSYTLFHAYLRGKGIHKVPLAHFVGNRLIYCFMMQQAFIFYRII